MIKCLNSEHGRVAGRMHRTQFNEGTSLPAGQVAETGLLAPERDPVDLHAIDPDIETRVSRGGLELPYSKLRQPRRRLDIEARGTRGRCQPAFG